MSSEEPPPPGGYGTIDLNQRLQELGISVSAEPHEQIRHRLTIELRESEQRLQLEIEQKKHDLKQAEADAQHKRESDQNESNHRRRVFWWVFLVVIAAGAAAFGIILFYPDASPETQSWARTVASAIVAGVIGYFGGVSRQS